jgi:hypothetical protein
LEAGHERAAEQVKQALEAAKGEHEAQLQTLRDRLKKVRKHGVGLSTP